MLVEAHAPGTLRSAYLFEPIVVPKSSLAAAGQQPAGRGGTQAPGRVPSKAAALYPLRHEDTAAGAERRRAGDVRRARLRGAPQGTARLKLSPAHRGRGFRGHGQGHARHPDHDQAPVTVAIGVIEDMRPSTRGARSSPRRWPTAASCRSRRSATSARSKTRRASPPACESPGRDEPRLLRPADPRPRRHAADRVSITCGEHSVTRAELDRVEPARPRPARRPV